MYFFYRHQTIFAKTFLLDGEAWGPKSNSAAGVDGHYGSDSSEHYQEYCRFCFTYSFTRILIFPSARVLLQVYVWTLSWDFPIFPAE